LNVLLGNLTDISFLKAYSDVLDYSVLSCFYTKRHTWKFSKANVLTRCSALWCLLHMLKYDTFGLICMGM